MRRVLYAILVCSGVLVVGAPADAGCHAFTATAPNSVEEGTKIPVKIERDNGFNPSSVRVRTVAGEATAPSDYTAIDQRVEFTNETSQVIFVQTTEDSVPEGREGFAVRLSDGQGCAVNPNFTYDVEPIAITDDDQAAAATTAPPAATTAPPAVTTTESATASPSPSPGTTPGPSPTASPTESPLAVDVVEDEGGFPWAPVGIVLGVAAVGAGALILTRMRRRPV